MPVPRLLSRTSSRVRTDAIDTALGAIMMLNSPAVSSVRTALDVAEKQAGRKRQEAKPFVRSADTWQQLQVIDENDAFMLARAWARSCVIELRPPLPAGR
jgi:hypothetical protein